MNEASRAPRSRLARAVAIAAIALAIPACGSSPTLPPSAASPIVGKPLPDFKRRTLAGSDLDTTELRGRTVVVKFFAEYCEPCMRTLPAAQALAAEHPEVVIIGVSEDERRSTAKALVDRFGITFPVVHDPDQILAGRFRVTQMPATFVASKTGAVRWFGGPEQSESQLAQAVSAVERSD